MQFSTVDTAEMVAGALFAGNFYGGEVKVMAEALGNSVDWSCAIGGKEAPATIYPVVDFHTGSLSGNI
jgi:hypothetical protein